jgi:hypothetical protein
VAEILGDDNSAISLGAGSEFKPSETLPHTARDTLIAVLSPEDAAFFKQFRSNVLEFLSAIFIALHEIPSGIWLIKYHLLFSHSITITAFFWSLLDYFPLLCHRFGSLLIAFPQLFDSLI